MERNDWLKWRHAGLGSSDAPVIMGLSPYKTRFQLWKEKISDFSAAEDNNSFIKQLGNDMEPKIRALFEFDQGTEYPPALRELSEYTWCRASFDGLSANNIPLEIKLLGREHWDTTKAGKVPAHYLPQVNHGLLVSGAPYAFFVALLYEKGSVEINLERMAIVRLERNDEHITKLFRELCFFRALVETRTPPGFVKEDYKPLRFKGARDLTIEWSEARKKLNEIESRLLERVDNGERLRIENLYINNRIVGTMP